MEYSNVMPFLALGIAFIASILKLSKNLLINRFEAGINTKNEKLMSIVIFLGVVCLGIYIILPIDKIEYIVSVLFLYILPIFFLLINSIRYSKKVNRIYFTNEDYIQIKQKQFKQRLSLIIESAFIISIVYIKINQFNSIEKITLDTLKKPEFIAIFAFFLIIALIYLMMLAENLNNTFLDNLKKFYFFGEEIEEFNKRKEKFIKKFEEEEKDYLIGYLVAEDKEKYVIKIENGAVEEFSKMKTKKYNYVNFLKEDSKGEIDNDTKS